MQKINLFITVLLFVPLVSFGQEYYVSERGGVNVHEAPDAKARKLKPFFTVKK